MLEDDYGFYVDLDESNEKKYDEELDYIDKYENKYYERLNRNSSDHHKWTFIETIQCFWFLVQTVVYRYVNN